MGTLVSMNEGRVDPPLDSAPWLSLAEAAAALGVSEKTVRRRAKAGQVEARQVSTQHGPAWQVRLPSGVDTVSRVDPPLDSGQGGQGTQRVQAGATAMLELVRLVAELQPKAEAAAMWQARAMMLADRLAIAEGKLDALTAPQQPQEPTQDVSGAAESIEAPLEPPTAPTWLSPRRWGRWVAAAYGW